MLAGPIFSREVLTTPRQFRHYLMRSGYVALLFVLMYTAGQATFGWQQLRNIGDTARFGELIFQLFCIVQISLISFFALLFAAGNVAQEKDKETLLLLLMTDLRSRELVLGKLFSSLLSVAVLLLVSLPLFCFVHMLGGVSVNQLIWTFAISVATSFVCGSWGSLIAFWREKTFQTLALSVLGAVLFLGLLEAVIATAGVESFVGSVAAWLNPFRALMSVLNPLNHFAGLEPIHASAWQTVLALSVLGILLNVVTIVRLRVWNPSRFVYHTGKNITKKETAEKEALEKVEENLEEEAIQPATNNQKTRDVWDKPILWREICTRAYGRKMFIIKLAYLILAFFIGTMLFQSDEDAGLVLGMISSSGFGFVVLSLMSLILINAQAVTSITSERDGKTLELLLVTDITAKEFIYGKIGGVFYNTKELILIPLALMAYALFSQVITLENYLLLTISFLVLVAFVCTLGIHAGRTFANSRGGIANSLGTVFFLFIGIFIFMLLLVEARGSFMLQFQSFLVFIVAGSIGLYASLTRNKPSNALTIASATLPMLTFYAITSFLLSEPMATMLAVIFAYGWTTVAMLIPAISEFDVALGHAAVNRE
ncbi:hypothetical protein MNBD_PLANCTO02-2668 [hydrothermal vent metagenome]|uniref:ABC-2 type transporter transmembrane domain-containing protein n=1 Tax=hydrothermal vent metagenome TaxID=652676 RepID=A0A3B1E0A6_9ZZZZ